MFTKNSLLRIFIALIVCTSLLGVFLLLSQENTDIIYVKLTNDKCLNLYGERKIQAAVEVALKWTRPYNETYTDNQIAQQVNTSCDKFLNNQNYFLHLTKTKEESELPIAFSIVTYKSASQVERLLRTIYRPWNYYCIHVDKKSSVDFFNAIEELTRCLNSKYHNIINTENRVDIKWGQMSVLQADLNCMKELYDKYKDWKYLINLTGQEFPLKTNAELAKIFTAYKGANNVEGLYKRRNEHRVPTIRMPFPIVWYKGSVHVTINRDFVGYMFESSKSKIMLEALTNRSIPDEQFFATLNYNPQLRIPGSYIGDPEDPSIEFLTRYKNWGDFACESKKFVREICIWGVGDLWKMVREPHLFANKFHEDFQPATLKCLETWYYDKVEKEVKTGRIAINETFFSSLSFVKYRFIPPVV